MRSQIMPRTFAMLVFCLSFLGSYGSLVYAQDQVIQTSTGFYYPANRVDRGGYIGFGSRNDNYGDKCHLANDYSKNVGEKIFSIADGVVYSASMNVGNYGGDTPARSGGAIIIQHRTSDYEVFYALYGHLQNFQVQAGDFVVGGQHVGDVGPYISDGRSWPHLHFGISNGVPIYAGYTPTAACNDYRGFVNPGVFLENNIPAKHDFHGAGSLIDPENSCYGCNHDVAVAHANGYKGLVSFQWLYEENYCEFINIDVADDMNPLADKAITVGIIAGPWVNRENDKYYKATLPVSIGYPRKDYADYGSYNLAAVMLPEVLPNGSSIGIIATCGVGQNWHPPGNKTEISRIQKGIGLVNGHSWFGNASIINYSTTPNTGYGKSKDIARINKGAAFFQWQPSAFCEKLKIHANEESLSVKLSIKEWSQYPNNDVVSFSLPYTLNKTNQAGYYYIVSVLVNQSSTTSNYVYADCIMP
jgi:hypothetical protein